MSRWKSTSVLSTTCAVAPSASHKARLLHVASCAVARCMVYVGFDILQVARHIPENKTMRAAHESTRSAAQSPVARSATDNVASTYSIRCARTSRHGTARARARGVTADVTATRRRDGRRTAYDRVGVAEALRDAPHEVGVVVRGVARERHEACPSPRRARDMLGVANEPHPTRPPGRTTCKSEAWGAAARRGEASAQYPVRHGIRWSSVLRLGTDHPDAGTGAHSGRASPSGRCWRGTWPSGSLAAAERSTSELRAACDTWHAT